MSSLIRVFLVGSSILAAANAQGVILSAQGTKGSPASLPLQVDTTKSDANIINLAEVSQNVVNECGRTLLGGNIDIGEQTETQLANKTVTSVTKGGQVAVTIRQLDANGKGPYTCDVDQTSNANGISGQVNLTVTEKAARNGDIALTVTMPDDLACIGASTGDICTVRCFNTATAGPFGGCFAVQQTDVKPSANSAATIASAQTLEGVEAQIAQNKIDLPAAVKAIQGASLEDQGVELVDEILQIDSTALATAGAAAASNPASAKSGKNRGKGGKEARAFAS